MLPTPAWLELHLILECFGIQVLRALGISAHKSKTLLCYKLYCADISDIITLPLGWKQPKLFDQFFTHKNLQDAAFHKMWEIFTRRNPSWNNLSQKMTALKNTTKSIISQKSNNILQDRTQTKTKTQNVTALHWSFLPI